MATNFIPKIEFNATVITFDFPNKRDPFGQQVRWNGKTSVSRSGNQQTVTDYIEDVKNVQFSFMSQTIKEELETFLTSHALLGKSFDYSEDKGDVTTKNTYELDRSSMKPKFKVLTRKGTGFLWEIKLKFRRVL